MAFNATIQHQSGHTRRGSDSPADSRSQPSPEHGPKVGSIVAIDDDPLTLRLLSAHLSKAGYDHKTADNGTDGLELVDDSTAVVVLDLRLPDLSGFQILQYLKEHHVNVQVIVLTGSDQVKDAVEAMRAGAFQFVTKPFDPDQFLVFIDKAFNSWKVADENTNLKSAHSQSVPVREMESTADVHVRLMQQVDQIASLDSTVFIGGETGTGKSTIARMIHQRSKRSAGPFVTVNCASLPRDLIQSELFGHTKGSFTGAVTDRIGHAEVADGGTLFLDEIGDLPIDLQPKLLTFLQERTVRRLGASESNKVDVRLVAATHHDLAALCRQGLFRQDLYFRLLVLNLELPALRHRTGELPNIANSIIEAVCERQGISRKTISSRAMEMLEQHAWPGNIRELENVLERATAFAKSDAIEPQDLLFSNAVFDQRTLTESSLEPTPAAIGFQLAGKTLEEIERAAIIETLDMLGGNKAKSARTLGISEKSIYNKMKRLKIEY
ncbi:sigma-54-dependent transcriptional regulator [Mariniblastus fucicola]|uniref:Transcriptional regulatory protein ZraR n=1 Tax=Mariniblastus fucicola TaxID=980251 RepID=A0A5B9PEL3_9BACT|nr:sigma-54 dependent transcriptional regulator [Mariniblastus fucicola]QEG23026.1 Transcriptional regulatory protein ZraR [Mariniblastus fucicola]